MGSTQEGSGMDSEGKLMAAVEKGTIAGSGLFIFLMIGKLSLVLLFNLDLVQGFYTTVQVPYETVLFEHLQRECEDGHKK
jgi:hypothetical protein